MNQKTFVVGLWRPFLKLPMMQFRMLLILSAAVYTYVSLPKQYVHSAFYPYNFTYLKNYLNYKMQYRSFSFEAHTLTPSVVELHSSNNKPQSKNCNNYQFTNFYLGFLKKLVLCMLKKPLQSTFSTLPVEQIDWIT